MVSKPSSSLKEEKDKFLDKNKHFGVEVKEKLKKERLKHIDQIKKYKKIIPEDRFKRAEK